MDILELIKSRRTIRKFKDEKIPEEVKNEIFEAATWAPSHRNEQPWEFYLVGKETRGKLLKLYQSVAEKMMQMPDISEPAKKFMATLKEDFGGAPLMFAILSKPGDDELHDRENDLAVGTAVQNMFLTAWNKGIGGVWLTVGSTPPAREILQVPEEYKVISLIAMGYPDEEPAAPPRIDYHDKTKQLP